MTKYNIHQIISIDYNEESEAIDYTWKSEIKFLGIIFRRKGFRSNRYLWNENDVDYFIEDDKLFYSATAHVYMSNNDYFVIRRNNIKEVRREVNKMIKESKWYNYYG